MRSVPRPFSSSYLAGEEIARRFIPLDFRSGADRMARTRAAAERQVAPALLAVLRDQQAALPASRARARQPGGARAPEAPRWWRPASRSGFFWARSTASTRRPRRSPWRGRWRRSRASAACRSSGCRPRTTTSPRSPRRRSPAAAASRCALSLPAETAAEARVSIAHRRLPSEVGALLEQLAELLGAGSGRQGDAGPPALPLHRRTPDRPGVRRRPGRAVRRRGAPDLRSARGARRRARGAHLPRGARRLYDDRAAPRRARRGAGGGGLRPADPRAARLRAGVRSPRRGDRPSLSAGTSGRDLGPVRRLRRLAAGRSRRSVFSTEEIAERWRTIRSASRPPRCCGRSCRTRCCRRPPTSGARRR